MKPFCSSTRVLTVEHGLFVYDLYGTGSEDPLTLRCALLDHHDHHIAPVVVQELGTRQIHWWASWRHHEGHQFAYSLFAAPTCTYKTSDRLPCRLIEGHEGDHNL